ncbi:hypothetical protein ACFXGT_39030 [Streptomyces sp. NPDC059352]|uniref:hypothetical protein n=1 Tax=Streptomyces sp. NPDC059352 TaxID=3346810 RepID=UPI003689F7BE
MKIIDLAEQTRLLGLLPGELGVLRTEIDGVRAGEIARPVREIAPIAVRTHQLAIRCLQQLDALLALSARTGFWHTFREGSGQESGESVSSHFQPV